MTCLNTKNGQTGARRSLAVDPHARAVYRDVVSPDSLHARFDARRAGQRGQTSWQPRRASAFVSTALEKRREPAFWWMVDAATD